MRVVGLATAIRVTSIPDAQQHSCSNWRQVTQQHDAHGNGGQDLHCERITHVQGNIVAMLALCQKRHGHATIVPEPGFAVALRPELVEWRLKERGRRAANQRS